LRRTTAKAWSTPAPKVLADRAAAAANHIVCTTSNRICLDLRTASQLSSQSTISTNRSDVDHDGVRN
jgi:hypothetical protein